MNESLKKLKTGLLTAYLWVTIGLILGGHLRPDPVPVPTPVPVPAPIARPAPVHHTGHLTVSYIEPRYGSPSSAAVRDALAGVDWHALDCTFRAYTEGQDELTTLGFAKHFTAADLPVLFVQESTPTGAPIIPPPLKSPDSAAAVLARVKELRGN